MTAVAPAALSPWTGLPRQPTSPASSADEGAAPRPSPPNPVQRLDEEALREVEKLARRDQEVRRHEMAHLAAAGPYARSGIQLEYALGPDGRRYAVGGEVSIDTAPVPGDPEATLEKARAIRAAAMAPAEPSGQDRQVAVEAARLMAEAQAQLARERSGKTDAGKEAAATAADAVAAAYDTTPPAAPRLEVDA